MKLEFFESQGRAAMRAQPALWQVRGETDRLTDVLLCPPAFLEPVPCCSVTREQLRDGFTTCRATALEQHRRLRAALEGAGVRCHMLPAPSDLPDLSFTRDAAVTTPWGLIALNPALPHRSREVDHVVASLRTRGVTPFARITAGTVEGGDVCVVRPGLAVIGCSGERTDEAGAEATAAIFRRHGWEAIVHRFDPHFLHLDTMFCMLDEHTALACTDVLSDDFLEQMAARGIALLPVTYKEARALGCNVLSIDGRTILTSTGQERVEAMLAATGFDPVATDISQFTACGGGLHCLTMPLARAA